MNLVVNVGTTNESVVLTIVVTGIEQCQRVRHVGYTIVGERPCRVTIVISSNRPLEVTAEIIQRLFSNVTAHQCSFFVVLRSKKFFMVF